MSATDSLSLKSLRPFIETSRPLVATWERLSKSDSEFAEQVGSYVRLKSCLVKSEASNEKSIWHYFLCPTPGVIESIHGGAFTQPLRGVSESEKKILKDMPLDAVIPPLMSQIREEAKNDIKLALDHLYVEIDNLMEQECKDKLNYIFRALNVDKRMEHSLTLAIGYLTATLPMASKLSDRRFFLKKLRKWLKIEKRKDAKELLRGLDR